MEPKYPGGASIDEYDASYLQQVVATLKTAKNGELTVLEFGPGMSTGLFLEMGCEVDSFEENRFFRLKAQKQYPLARIRGYENVPVLRLETRPQYDLAFVDSPRVHPIEVTPLHGRWNSVELAMKLAPHVLLHDAYREREKNIIESWQVRGCHAQIFPTPRGLAYFRRETLPHTNWGADKRQ